MIERETLRETVGLKERGEMREQKSEGVIEREAFPLFGNGNCTYCSQCSGSNDQIPVIHTVSMTKL